MKRGEYSYLLSVCGQVKSGCNGGAASGCITNINSNGAWSMGSYHEGNLVLDDSGLTLAYNGGSQCSRGQVRSTMIRFVCDKNAGVGAPEITEEFYCFYSITWRTRYACPTQGSGCAFYDKDGALYDLTSLGSRNWRVKGTQEELWFTVCGEAPQCPGGSLCKIDDDGRFKPVSSSALSFDNTFGSLVLMYGGMGECEGSVNPVSLDLRCKPGSVETNPELVTSQDCDYKLLWETAEACPAHTVQGDECFLTDTVTGLHFDISPLGQSPINVQLTGDGGVLAVQLCGSLKGSACGEGVSVCGPNDTPLGYTRHGTRAADKLVYSGGELTVPLEGAACEGEQLFQTIIELFCQDDPSVSDATIGYKIGPCAYYIMLKHPSACPAFPLQCTATNDSHSVDLEVLYEAGNLEWSGVLNNTQTALYVRVCGQTTAPLCDKTAGVCAVMDRDGVRVAMNLGRASGYLTLSDRGVVTETYSNGDSCNNGEKANTVVEHNCLPGTQPVIHTALFNAQHCMYVIGVTSGAACVQHAEISQNCSITEPNTGITYDFSYLTEDYAFSNVNSHFRLHVCGTLTGGCGGEGEVAACETVNGNHLSLGVASTSSLTLSDGVFTLTYTGGDSCSSTTGVVEQKKTVITLLCNRNEPAGIPKYVNEDAESCVYHFEWEVAGACAPAKPLCTAIDGALREYDLSVLEREDSWRLLRDGTLVYLNVCGASNACGGESAACYIQGNKVTSLGRVSGEPVAHSEGQLELTYYHGDECRGGGLWTTSIMFYCERRAESMPEVRLDMETCTARVEWRTLHACPGAHTKGSNCSVSNPNTGVEYDLWGLSGRDFAADYDEHTYTFSFCTPLSQPCNGVTTAGSCQVSRDTGDEKDNGNVNTEVTFSDGAILMKYIGGDTCSQGDIRETGLTVVCDHALADVQLEIVKVEEVSHCSYHALAYSGLPCDKEVLSRCELDEFDISGLALTRDNYLVSRDSTTFTLNVCRGLNTPAPCSPDTAICLRKGVASGISVGSVESATLIQEDSTLKLRYSGGDLCPSTGEPYTSTITFLCQESAGMGSPALLSNSTCSYHFLWATQNACAARQYQESCQILDDLTREPLLDLTALKGIYKGRDTTGNRGDYSISLCIDLPPSSPCKKDSAVCITDAFDFSTSLGLLTSETELSRRTEKGAVSLTYRHGDICVREDGTTIPYSTTVDFVCAPAVNGGVSWINTEDCEARFIFKTSLVCAQDRVSCEVEVDGRTVDLAPLAATPQYLVSNRVGLEGYILVSVCETLPHISSDSCPPDSSACLHTDWPNKATDLGKLVSPLQVATDGTVQLTYSHGAACEEGSISTQISFYCDKTATPVPYLADVSACEYSIMWPTPLVCPGEEGEPTKGCKITDSSTGFSYDLAEAALAGDFYRGTVDGVEYRANVCGTVTDCGRDVAICFISQTGGLSLGRNSTAVVSLPSEKGEVQIDYTDGDATTKCTGGTSSSVVVVCCDSQNSLALDLISISDDGCHYTFVVCSHEVCRFDREECLFQMNGTLYDFSPLARRYDNWIINEDDKTIAVNPCRGVNTEPATKGCKSGSVACLKEKAVGGSESLGKVSERSHKLDTDGNVVVMYGGGDICARTEIRFICSTSLGAPTFIGEKSCQYKFEWKTRAACTNSAKPIPSGACGILVNVPSLWAEEGEWTVEIAACGGSLEGGSVARITQTGLKPIYIDSHSKEVYSEGSGSSLEMVIESTVACASASKRNWRLVVQYTCTQSGNTARILALTHCHVIVAVDTPVVCTGYSPPKHTRVLLLVLLLISVVFISLLALFVCLKKEFRTKLLRKMRAVLPVRGARPNTTMAYKRLQLESDSSGEYGDSDEEVLAL